MSVGKNADAQPTSSSWPLEPFFISASSQFSDLIRSTAEEELESVLLLLEALLRGLQVLQG